MRIGRADTVAAADAIEGLASAVESGRMGAPDDDVIRLCAVAIVRSGISCKAIDLVDVPWFLAPADRAAAEKAVASVPADRIARLQANRVDDGFYSTFVVRKLSKPMTAVALKLGMSPNSITLISFAVGLLAAGSFALGDRWALVIGAILLQLSLIIDCVDGEVARATRRFSALGAWLDASTDRVKEYLAYAGLAAGAALHGVDIWWLALVMMVLQTTRHMTDYDFSRVQRQREAVVPITDIIEQADLTAASGWSVSGAMEISTRMNSRNAIRWAKRAIHMPIGERWLVISVFAIIGGAAWALGVLLALGVVALAYVTAGRVLRSLSWHGSSPTDAWVLLWRQADAGPVLSGVGRLISINGIWAAPFGWAVPALLRLVELGLVAALAIWLFPSATTVAFWWVAVIAFHHYDVLYRAIQGRPTPRWITWAGLGWDGRTIVVIVVAILGLAAFTTVLGWGALVLAIILVAIASVQWLRSGQ
jgi:phosphatidylglycerophosphate synthase